MVNVESMAIMRGQNCTFCSLEVTGKGGTRAGVELVGTLAEGEKQQRELENRRPFCK